MLSSALRAGRRISLRHFSAPAAPAEAGAPLLLSSPPNAASSSAAVGHGRRRKTASTVTFVPPSAPQLSPDHGLYGFFRAKSGKNLRGDERYETFHDPDVPMNGRSWEASELRLKSFKDLHTLWYVLLRECNLLATQREEMRRLGVLKERITNRTQAARCRKSMARIKGVMNERRLAYEGAVELAEKEREAAMNAEVLEFKVNEETTAWHKQHAEQIRHGVIPPPRTHRGGVQIQARREGVEVVKKERWTKEQKLANAEYKARKAERKLAKNKGPRVLTVA